MDGEHWGSLWSIENHFRMFQTPQQRQSIKDCHHSTGDSLTNVADSSASQSLKREQKEATCIGRLFMPLGRLPCMFNRGLFTFSLSPKGTVLDGQAERGFRNHPFSPRHFAKQKKELLGGVLTYLMSRPPEIPSSHGLVFTTQHPLLWRLTQILGNKNQSEGTVRNGTLTLFPYPESQFACALRPNSCLIPPNKYALPSSCSVLFSW